MWIANDAQEMSGEAGSGYLECLICVAGLISSEGLHELEKVTDIQMQC